MYMYEHVSLGWGGVGGGFLNMVGADAAWQHSDSVSDADPAVSAERG